MLHDVDKNLKSHNFSTRTEFVRTAIRDKLQELKKEDMIDKFIQFKGAAKKSTSDENNRVTREIIGKELLKELNKQFK